MKKLLSIFFFLLGSICVSAQKSYVHIYAENISRVDYHNIHITGDIPNEVLQEYYFSEEMTIGRLLNLLADKGYVLEFMTAPARFGQGFTYDMCYVLSKVKEAPSNSIKSVKADDDDSDASEVHEVARYNLQGLPISEKEKGVQIVVYSNYTTKTIIRE